CPKGTILSRLARARERLRVCLTRRGVALSAGALAALAREAEAVTVPAAQVQASLQIAAGLAAGHAAAAVAGTHVAAFREGVLRSLFVRKRRVGLGAVRVLGVGGGGAGSRAPGWRGKGDQQRAGAGEQAPAVPGQGPGGGPGEEPRDPAKLAARVALSAN